MAAGAAIGLLAASLQYGEPAKHGAVHGLFSRGHGGRIGLHRESAVQYLRPEIMGAVLGCAGGRVGIWRMAAAGVVLRSCDSCWARWPRWALVFLGCPWRAFCD